MKRNERHVFAKRILLILFAFACGMTLGSSQAIADKASDEKAVAALDTEYQAAVEKNDAATMDRILHDDFILVLGNGTVITKADLIKEAKAGSIKYEQQKEV